MLQSCTLLSYIGNGFDEPAIPAVETCCTVDDTGPETKRGRSVFCGPPSHSFHLISFDEYYLTSITFLDSSAVFWIFGMFTFRTPFSTCALMFSLSAFSGRTIVCWNCE